MFENHYRNEIHRLLTIALRRVLAVGPPTPVAPSVESIEEVFMPTHEFKYTFGLPAASAPDVAKFVLTVNVDGSTEQVEVAATDTSFVRSFAPGAHVDITLVDVDSAGNASQPSTPLTFEVTDTVPPPTPGAMTIQDVEEVFTPDEPPTPEPTP
jgi:hypothetical protein